MYLTLAPSINYLHRKKQVSECGFDQKGSAYMPFHKIPVLPNSLTITPRRNNNTTILDGNPNNSKHTFYSSRQIPLSCWYQHFAKLHLNSPY